MCSPAVCVAFTGAVVITGAMVFTGAVFTGALVFTGAVAFSGCVCVCVCVCVCGVHRRCGDHRHTVVLTSTLWHPWGKRALACAWCSQRRSVALLLRSIGVALGARRSQPPAPAFTVDALHAGTAGPNAGGRAQGQKIQ